MEALAALAAQQPHLSSQHAPVALQPPPAPETIRLVEQKRGPGRPPKNKNKDSEGGSDKGLKRKMSESGLSNDGPIITGMKQDRNMRPRTQRWSLQQIPQKLISGADLPVKRWQSQAVARVGALPPPLIDVTKAKESKAELITKAGKAPLPSSMGFCKPHMPKAAQDNDGLQNAFAAVMGLKKETEGMNLGRKDDRDPSQKRRDRYHEKDKNFVCTIEGCGRQFTDSFKLKRHMFSHTGERPWLCPIEGCGKRFSLDFNLRSHIKTHKNIDISMVDMKNLPKATDTHFKFVKPLYPEPAKEPRAPKAPKAPKAKKGEKGGTPPVDPSTGMGIVPMPGSSAPIQVQGGMIGIPAAMIPPGMIPAGMLPPAGSVLQIPAQMVPPGLIPPAQMAQVQAQLQAQAIAAQQQAQAAAMAQQQAAQATSQQAGQGDAGPPVQAPTMTAEEAQAQWAQQAALLGLADPSGSGN